MDSSERVFGDRGMLTVGGGCFFTTFLGLSGHLVLVVVLVVNYVLRRTESD